MPHDATAYEPTYSKTPSETAAEVAQAVEGVREEYGQHAREASAQYQGLTGTVPTPVLTQLVPSTAVAVTGPDFTIRIQGSGFTSDSLIWWNDHYEPTTLVSPTEVTTGVIPSSIGGPASLPVEVHNGSLKSNTLVFTFTAAQQEEPSASWAKNRIVNWLLQHGAPLSESGLNNMTKADLLAMAAEIVEDPPPAAG